jgi:hypothetical protein
MLLNKLCRMIFNSYEAPPKAAPVKVARRIQRVCVLTAVEFERQAKMMQGQREELAAQAHS